jgi:hypothetical protein
LGERAISADNTENPSVNTVPGEPRSAPVALPAGENRIKDNTARNATNHVRCDQPDAAHSHDTLKVKPSRGDGMIDSQKAGSRHADQGLSGQWCWQTSSLDIKG